MLSPYQNAKYALNPFHAALNFAFALLEGQVMQSIIASGLEPTCGYLHTYRSDRIVNSLCHDLMEPFRAIIDAKVLAFFEKTTFHHGDFYQMLSGECRLNEQLRRYLLASCRVEQHAIDDIVCWLCKMLSP